jgi:hypothetical protein
MRDVRSVPTIVTCLQVNIIRQMFECPMDAGHEYALSMPSILSLVLTVQLKKQEPCATIDVFPGEFRRLHRASLPLLRLAYFVVRRTIHTPRMWRAQEPQTSFHKHTRCFPVPYSLASRDSKPNMEPYLEFLLLPPPIDLLLCKSSSSCTNACTHACVCMPGMHTHASQRDAARHVRRSGGGGRET